MSTPMIAGRPLGFYFSLENRYLPPMLITLILLGAQLGFGVLESFTKTLLAIGCAIAAELVLAWLVVGRLPVLASAYISGISVGILVRSPFFWPFALGSLIAIVSKYAIRWRGRHLFNPSNFAVCALFVLAPEAVASLSVQWGNNLWPVALIWTLGGVIIWRLGRFHVCAAYVVTFLALGFARGVITGDGFLTSIAPITGPMYQLFVLFMITDPKTTLGSRNGRIAVAVLVGVVEMLLRLNEVVHAPYFALFLVGPTALALELWRQGPQGGGGRR